MKPNTYPGKFIVFEGLDGSGKSTQANLLVDFLQQQLHQKTHYTSEPTPNIIGGLIRSQIAGDWKTSNECLQLLFSADRLYHLEKEETLKRVAANYEMLANHFPDITNIVEGEQEKNLITTIIQERAEKLLQ